MKDYNIALALRQVAATQSEQIALVAREGKIWRQWTFHDLNRNSEGFATALHLRGVRQGDRVMLMVRPSMEFFCLTFALFHLGAVVILIDPGMGYRNLLRCIGSVRPDILVGISKAILFSWIFRSPFVTVRKRIQIGRAPWSMGPGLEPAEGQEIEGRAFQAGQNDPAAILFTTGSTGPPKGVEYTHGIFHAQLRLIRDYYGIGSGDVDQPGFPLFGLFATALGAKAVIPDMDPTRPAQVDPAKFVTTLIQHQVTYSFGSPAIWNVVSRYCLDEQIMLPVRKVLMAGAPVPGELVDRVRRVLPEKAEIFTPYGATESLPVASIEGREILGQTWALTRIGRGACVGKALPGVHIRIIEPGPDVVASWSEVRELPPGEIGEIVVQGPVVTRAYAFDEHATRKAKIVDGESFWHRMGDMGYCDDQQRLWFCGRAAHRVATARGMMYTIPCEAVFNEHPLVRRSALVGLGPWGKQQPVIVVEAVEPIRDQKRFVAELRQLAMANELTLDIEQFLLHPGFPVDIRHNAKIFREQLAQWAGRQSRLQCGC
ncbi:fatty acid CoA ligase family protein [Desulfobulbus alkaliphilus]|uniref:fatty acid CoA ligase family protein n=1 Tax=Desulfobulbus alkaliphilus TaxID=869814 RepID=UPI0019657716|nr:fatty acid CoA ligase family protein [Desulfobulbus alkaliphilus]MBM9537256.1 AMP-binding protein [Desulfobulbus alkaliphilus]